MRVQSLKLALVDWLMQAVIPGLPWHIQLFAGFAVPMLESKVDELIRTNEKLLRESGALTESGLNPDRLRDAFALPFRYRDKIEIEMGDIKFAVTAQNVTEIINAAVRLDTA